MDVIFHNLSKIKKGLPKQYAKVIAKEVPGMTAQQVRNVFHGNITDPDTVLSVLDAAKKVKDKTDSISTAINELAES